MQYVMFTKHLQELSVPDAGRAIKELGFDGVELTTRPGGHILPEEVETTLPAAVEQLQALGLTVPALVVEIHNRRTPHAAAVCRTAGALGATLLRTSSWRYLGLGSARSQLATARAECKELEDLGREYGVRFCIHAHSGSYLSGQGALLAQILDGRDPRYVGVSLDMGHLTVEGGIHGWRISMDLLRDYVGILAVKSFGWFRTQDPQTGQHSWRATLVPLAEGLTQWTEVFKILDAIGWDGLVSLHSEYNDMTVPVRLAQTARDLAHIRASAAATTTGTQ